MTPNRTYPVNEVISRCGKINLKCRNSGVILMIDTARGILLRGFQLWFAPSRVDADDFDNWWRFMGYDK